MTAKIISLTRVRKSRARDEKRQQAVENAAKHGRSKAEKAAERARAALAQRLLDQHRRDEE